MRSIVALTWLVAAVLFAIQIRADDWAPLQFIIGWTSLVVILLILRGRLVPGGPRSG